MGRARVVAQWPQAKSMTAGFPAGTMSWVKISSSVRVRSGISGTQSVHAPRMMPAQSRNFPALRSWVSILSRR